METMSKPEPIKYDHTQETLDYLLRMCFDTKAEIAALRSVIERSGIAIDERAYRKAYVEARMEVLCSMGQVNEYWGTVSLVMIDTIEKFRQELAQRESL